LVSRTGKKKKERGDGGSPFGGKRKVAGFGGGGGGAAEGLGLHAVADKEGRGEEKKRLSGGEKRALVGEYLKTSYPPLGKEVYMTAGLCTKRSSMPPSRWRKKNTRNHLRPKRPSRKTDDLSRS